MGGIVRKGCQEQVIEEGEGEVVLSVLKNGGRRLRVGGEGARPRL